MPVKRNALTSIVLKSVGTLALAVAFVAMVGRAPFLPDEVERVDGGSDAAVQPVPGPGIQTAALDGAMALPVQASDHPMPGPLQPSMGLFKANFSGSAEGGGFATAEHRVSGTCEGAGLRYIEEVCPDCQATAGKGQGDLPAMLVWTDPDEPAGSINSVTADCISVSIDGAAIVGTLTLGGDTLDLADGLTSGAAGYVPLIAGATRVAAIEIGGWIATFDHVGRPSTALADMATLLVNRGWREVSDPPSDPSPDFEGERIFVNGAGVHCVISLSKQDQTHQLISIISSGLRG